MAILPPRPDLRALRPLLLHAHFGRGGALALPIAQALGIPLVVTFHGADATKETHYRPRVVPRIYARRLAAAPCIDEIGQAGVAFGYRRGAKALVE